MRRVKHSRPDCPHIQGHEFTFSGLEEWERRRERRRDSRRNCAGRGFTLTELLIVIGIVAVLVALLFPALSWLRRSGEMARELSAARQLMVAYTSYAYDNNGVLMPGRYYPPDIGGSPAPPPLPAFDLEGNLITEALPASRYPWRLAQYLDNNFSALYLAPAVQAVAETWHDEIYALSVYPSMGINSVFLGGDTGFFAYSTNPNVQAFGDFYLTSLSKARHPARLITFASAREYNSLPGTTPGNLEGFHLVLPPYFLDRRWVNSYDEATHPSEFGHISLRLGNRQAGIGYLDGSTGTLDEGRIQDMRHWSDQATAPDWTLTPQ